jgi:RNA polymerase sigma-70 factor (ECF subfamily)
VEAGLTENTMLRTIKSWLWGEDVEGSRTDAFTRLYEETHLIIFRYVYGLSGGPLQEAEDLTAETYARAWKTRQRLPSDKNPALGWLLRIARNLAIDLSRRRKARDMDENTPVELLVDPSLLPEMNVITREQIRILWQMLDTLGEEVREMLVLRYLLGWQVRQIAVHLGLNENTVTVTIRRALKSLQRDWPKSQEHDHE